jgi:hypothetical protein
MQPELAATKNDITLSCMKKDAVLSQTSVTVLFCSYHRCSMHLQAACSVQEPEKPERCQPRACAAAGIPGGAAAADAAAGHGHAAHHILQVRAVRVAVRFLQLY